VPFAAAPLLKSLATFQAVRPFLCPDVAGTGFTERYFSIDIVLHLWYNVVMVTNNTILDLDGKSAEELETLWKSYSDAQDSLYASDDVTDAQAAAVEVQNQELVWLMIQCGIALGEEYGAADLPRHLRHLATF